MRPQINLVNTTDEAESVPQRPRIVQDLIETSFPLEELVEQPIETNTEKGSKEVSCLEQAGTIESAQVSKFETSTPPTKLNDNQILCPYGSAVEDLGWANPELACTEEIGPRRYIWTQNDRLTATNRINVDCPNGPTLESIDGLKRVSKKRPLMLHLLGNKRI